MAKILRYLNIFFIKLSSFLFFLFDDGVRDIVVFDDDIQKTGDQFQIVFEIFYIEDEIIFRYYIGIVQILKCVIPKLSSYSDVFYKRKIVIDYEFKETDFKDFAEFLSINTYLTSIIDLKFDFIFLDVFVFLDVVF